MATKIRLKRIGRRNRPFYRMVVMDERARRDGAAIEQLGWFNPLELDEEKNFSLNEERVFHWLGQGAQTTETAHNLLKRVGLAHKWHLMKQGLDEAAVEKEMKKWSMEREEVSKRRVEKAAKKEEENLKEAEKEAEAAAAAAEEEAPAEEEAAAEEEAPAEEESPTEEEAPAEEEAPSEEPKEDEAVEEENSTEEDTESEDEPSEDKKEDK